MSTFGQKALRKIGAYYAANTSRSIRAGSSLLDFDAGRPTNRRYTRAKVIDMIFFVEGGGS